VPPKAKVPGGELENPVSPEKILEEVSKLVTPDLHSVALTGGEPLAQPDLSEIMVALKRRGFQIYLESAGYPPDKIEEVSPYVDYAAIDLKLPSHMATSNYESLISSEIKCVKTLVDYSTEVFVKIVIDETTPEEEVLEVVKRIKDLDVEIILQPVSYEEVVVGSKKLERMSEIVGSIVGDRVRVIPQVHKFLKIR